jgi:hypothetical protein
VAQPAIAAKYDGSVALVCAAIAVTECGAEGECRQHRRVESVNIPSIWRVDAKRMKVHYPELNRESTIRNVDHGNGLLLLNGADSRYGWVVVIHEESGRMSASVSGHDEGYVIFGQCAIP